MSFSQGVAILVDNLASGTTAEDVELVFEDYGKILSCEIINSRNPDSCVGRIIYENEDSANDAVESVDGARADGKVLSVKLEKDGIAEHRGSPLNSPSEPDLSTDSVSHDDIEAKEDDAKTTIEPESQDIPKEQPFPPAAVPPSSTLQAHAPAFAPRAASSSPAPSSVADTALSSAIGSNNRFSEVLEPSTSPAKVVEPNGWFTNTRDQDLEGFVSAVLDGIDGLSKSGSDTSSKLSRPKKPLTIKKPQTAAPIATATKQPAESVVKKVDPSTLSVKPNTSPISMKATAPTFVSTSTSPPFQPQDETYQPASTYTQPLSLPNAGSMPFHPNDSGYGNPSLPTTMVPYTGFNGYNPQASPFLPISGRSNFPPELSAYQAVLEKADIYSLRDLQELLLNEKIKDKFVDDLAKEYPGDLKSFKLKFGLKVKLGQVLGLD